MDALNQLDDEIDTVVAEAGRERWSLCPTRARATTLSVLVRRYGDRHGLSEAVCRVGRAQLDSFPGNLFWDFDMVVSALASRESANELGATSERFVSLQRLYGQHSTVRFQYVHDFVYGYDWHRWVRERGGSPAVPPFGDAFLDYSIKRGHELVALIEDDDETYPKLPSGALRNPFGFRREPEDEARLFRQLAQRELIPVPAWQEALIGVQRTTFDYHAARAMVAAELGLTEPR